MQIKINEIDKKAIIEINPQDYFLKKLNKEHEFEGEYALVCRIDMSYAGKPDQEGSIAVYLSAQEAGRLKTIIDELI